MASVNGPDARIAGNREGWPVEERLRRMEESCVHDASNLQRIKECERAFTATIEIMRGKLHLVDARLSALEAKAEGAAADTSTLLELAHSAPRLDASVHALAAAIRSEAHHHDLQFALLAFAKVILEPREPAPERAARYSVSHYDDGFGYRVNDALDGNFRCRDLSHENATRICAALNAPRSAP